MRLVSAAAALSILLSGTVAAAQEPLEPLDPADVVASALTIEAFVPAGWVIEQRAEGTLTAAPQPDIVLQLVEQTTGFFRVRALVIVTRTAGGGFTRAAVAPTLLPPQRGEPNPSQPLDRPTLTIARNVLTISYHDTVARFRYEPVSKQFLLIGEDHTFKYDTSGVSSPQMRGMRGGGMVSTNYLTGNQIVEQREFDAKAQRDLVTSSHTDPVEKTRETIEEIDWTLDLFARRLFAAALVADLPLRPDDRIPVETDRGGIVRVPRVLLAQFLQDLPADEFQPDTLQWLAVELTAQKAALADPNSRPEDRVLPADAEFYWFGGPAAFCGTIGCSNSLYWASPATGQAGTLITVDGPGSELGPPPYGRDLDKTSTHGLFDIGGVKFNGKNYDP